MLLLALLLSVPAHLPQDPATGRLLQVPHAFERHPTAAGACFLARGVGGSLVVDQGGLALHPAGGSGGPALTVCFQDAAACLVAGERPSPRRSHYFLGSDPAGWRTDVATFAQVRCAGVWPGIDVVCHGRGGELEYDFEVAPGADPAQIRLRIRGGSPTLTEDGSLIVATPSGAVRQPAPKAWQSCAGQLRPVVVRFVLDEPDHLSFAVADHDPCLPLVIDPVIVFVALLDGSGPEQLAQIAVDAQGRAVVACRTASPNLPVQSPAQPGLLGNADVYIACFTPDGSNLAYATYLGSSGNDVPGGIAALANGSVAIGCFAAANDYPVLSPAFVGRSGSGVTVLSPTGSIVWSTYYTIPGSVVNVFANCFGVAAAANGDVLICGGTNAANLPVHAGAFQANLRGAGDAFVARFSAGGTFLGATYFGLTGVADALRLTMAQNGDVCVGGRIRLGSIPVRNAFQVTFAGGAQDAWVAVFDGALSVLRYASHFGGSGDEAETNGEQLGVAVDPQNRVALASSTRSADMPVTVDAFQTALAGTLDGFIAVFDPALTGPASLVYSSYFGGDGGDALQDIAIDAAGRYHLAGHTTSATGLPFIHPLRTPPGQVKAGLLAVLGPDRRTLRLCTPFGVNSHPVECEGIALGPQGRVFLAGTSVAAGIPVTVGAFQSPPPHGQAAVFAACLQLTFATRSTYGTGHAGTLGVPTLDASDDPVLGTTIDLLLGNAAGTPTFAALALGLTAAGVPTPFGGTLLVGAFLVPPITVPLPSAGAAFALPIPAATTFCGMSLFAQSVQIDAGAGGLLAFSTGLALRLGI